MPFEEENVDENLKNWVRNQKLENSKKKLNQKLIANYLTLTITYLYLYRCIVNVDDTTIPQGNKLYGNIMKTLLNFRNDNDIFAM